MTGTCDADVVAAQVPAAAGDQAVAELQVLRDALRDLLDGAGVGSLLASVAHAGNNRLTVILSCLDLLAGADIGDEDLRSAIALATGAAQQLANDFSSLLAGVRTHASPVEAVDLEWALRRVAVLDAFLHGGTFVTGFEGAAGLEVDAERERLVATLLRLCTIARRRGARSIRVGAGRLEVAARTAERPSLRKGRYCRVELEIVGGAWPEQPSHAGAETGHVGERLADADGLDYAAVQAFVAMLRGQVTTTSEPGSMRVELCLPAARRTD